MWLESDNTAFEFMRLAFFLTDYHTVILKLHIERQTINKTHNPTVPHSGGRMPLHCSQAPYHAQTGAS